MTLLPELSNSEFFRKVLWGDVDPTSYPNIKATVHCVRNPFNNDHDWTLCVKVQPVTHLLAVSPKNWMGGGTFVVPPAPEEFCVRWHLRGHDLLAIDNTAIPIVISGMRNQLRELLPRLWEVDPRIGTCDQHYPTFPLFDHGAGDINLRRKYNGCALCDYAYGSGDGYRTWGGGNIGWVHPSCLLRARLGDGNI